MLLLAIATIAAVFPSLVAPGSCISARAWGARWKGKKGPPDFSPLFTDESAFSSRADFIGYG